MNELRLLIDHVSLSVEDLDKACAFYEPALAPLGIEVVARLGPEITGGPRVVGFGIGRKGSLWISETGQQTPSTHICFRADSRAKVRAFYEAGMASGGTDNGAPGIREVYHPEYFGAFVRDPEGHNIEAVTFEPEAS